MKGGEGSVKQNILLDMHLRFCEEQIDRRAIARMLPLTLCNLENEYDFLM